MRRNFHTKLFLPLFAITLLFAYCKKGDPGATGPAGAAGQAGTTGSTGPEGPKGDTGTANVIYSPWLDVPFTADTVHDGTLIDTLGFYANIAATKLDSAMVASGEMKVYLNLGTSATPDVVPLPYLDIYSGVNITPTFGIQDIFLYANTDASTATISGLKYFQYRYILIPGGTVTARVQRPDWKDYNKVKIFYGLKD